MKKFKKILIFVIVALTVVSTGTVAFSAMTAETANTSSYSASAENIPTGFSDKNTNVTALKAVNVQPLAATKKASNASDFGAKIKAFFQKIGDFFKKIGDLFKIETKPSDPGKPTTTKPSTTKPTTTKPTTKPTTTKAPTGKVIYDTAFLNEAAAKINAERKKAGLSALKVDTGMAKVASVRAKELQTKFDHTRPNGSKSYTAYADCGVTKPSAVAENICMATKFGSASDIVTVWLNSSGHRANILNSKYTRFGMAWYIGTDGKQYAAMELGNG